MPPPNESATIHIKNLAPVSGNIFTMAAKPAISAKGDIYNLATGSGPIEVKFKIAKNMPGSSWDHSFNVSPFCAYLPGQAPCTITTGVPPALGFVVDMAANKQSFTLTIPDPTANPDVIYRLFVDRKDGAQFQTIIIDPRITNGGQPFEASLPKTYDAGLSALTLVLLAILMLAAGFGLGWVLAGGRRP
jgi:hypothetical protein